MSLKSSLNLTLVAAYLRFYFQTKRFYALLAIFLLVVLIEPLLILTHVTPRPVGASGLLSTPVGFYTDIGTLAGALLAGDAISQDFSRQGLFTLSQPIGRSRIMLTRYGSALIAAGGLVLLFFLVSALIAYAFYGGIVPDYPEMVGFGLLYVAALAAFVMLFSSLFKSPSISMVMAVLFVIVAMPIVGGILSFANIEPWFLVTYAGAVVSNLLSQPYPQHLRTIPVGPGFSVSIYTPTLAEAAAIMVGYLVASLAVCLIVYKRRELKEI